MVHQSKSAFAVALVCSWSITYADDVPDPAKTPGVARTDITQAEICSTKWGTDERHVTPAMKKQVFAPKGKRRCEVDHLISRELGGADVVKNLWPQPYGTTPWNASVKDKLENRLHKEMCAGRFTLKEAQDMLVNDWRVAYRKYYGEP
jgi:hypothetical protein